MRRLTTILVVILIAGSFGVGTARGKGDRSVTTVPAVTSTVEGQSHQATREVIASSARTAYALDWYSVNCGGTIKAVSLNHQMGASIGQSVAGEATSTNYRIGAGFWFGNVGGDQCVCDCHGDPVCDHVIVNVQDVVAAVNVAFRASAPLIDPNPACPREQTDVGGGPLNACDGLTNIVDVVKIVNVAFRNANPATEFCDPCA